MPAVALTNEQKLNKRLKKITDDTKVALYTNGIKQKDVAELAGIDQSSLSNQFRRGQLTLTAYLAAQMLLEEN